MRSFSLFLIAVGAILTFAISVFVEGVDVALLGEGQAGLRDRLAGLPHQRPLR